MKLILALNYTNALTGPIAHHYPPATLSTSASHLDMVAKSDIICQMNRHHRKTLAAIFNVPVSGNIEWRKIEALFKAAGCEIIEGRGSRIAVLYEGRKATFHRPHPGKNAMRYQIRAAREFLEGIGTKP